MKCIIINRFRAQGSERRKDQDLSSFFVPRRKKLDDEVARLRKACLKAKFTAWDNRLNLWNYHELTLLDGALDSKLQVATSRVLKIKADHYLMFGSTSKFIDEEGSSSNNFKSSLKASTLANACHQKNMELEFHEQGQLAFVNPSDQTLPQMLPFNLNSLNSPMLMMANGGDKGFLGSYYPSAANLMMNDRPRAYPISYSGLSRQLSAGLPNVSSRMHNPQLSEFCDINEFEMRNKKDTVKHESRSIKSSILQ